MAALDIRKVTLSDLNELQLIGRHTFEETFAASNSEENMAQYLKEGFSEEQLLSELQDHNSEFYFATEDTRVVGYLKVNFGAAQTELKDQRALEIERIYVLKAFHGLRVGQFLYDQAVHIAKQQGADYIWLGVWVENHRAIQFYTKNGFVVFDRHLFKLGTDEQTDLMMKLSLR